MSKLQRIYEDFPDTPVATEAIALGYFYSSVWPPQELDRHDNTTSAPLEWRKQVLAPGWNYVKALQAMPGQEMNSKRLLMLYSAAEYNFEQAAQIAGEILAEQPRNPEAAAIKELAEDFDSRRPPASPPNRAVNAYTYYYGICFGLGPQKDRGASLLHSWLEQRVPLETYLGLRAIYHVLSNGDTTLAQQMIGWLEKAHPSDANIQQFKASVNSSGVFVLK